MTEKIFHPRTHPNEAAQQVVLELVRSSGAELFKTKGVSEDSAQAVAKFITTLHKDLMAYYRSS